MKCRRYTSDCKRGNTAEAERVKFMVEYAETKTGISAIILYCQTTCIELEKELKELEKTKEELYGLH